MPYYCITRSVSVLITMIILTTMRMSFSTVMPTLATSITTYLITSIMTMAATTAIANVIFVVLIITAAIVINMFIQQRMPMTITSGHLRCWRLGRSDDQPAKNADDDEDTEVIKTTQSNLMATSSNYNSKATQQRKTITTDDGRQKLTMRGTTTTTVICRRRPSPSDNGRVHAATADGYRRQPPQMMARTTARAPQARGPRGRRCIFALLR